MGLGPPNPVGAGEIGGVDHWGTGKGWSVPCLSLQSPTVRLFPLHGKGAGPPQLHRGLCPVLWLQIIFEGVRGTSYEGDIAIDDVTLKKGDCPRKPIGPNKGESVCASGENQLVGVQT